MQPLVQTYSAWKETNSNTLLVMLGIYTLLVLYSVYRALTENFYTTIGPNGHFIWNTESGKDFVTNGIGVIGILYIVGLLLGLLWALPTTLPLFVIGLITLFVSRARTGTGEFASYWCYVAVAYSFVALAV